MSRLPLPTLAAVAVAALTACAAPAPAPPAAAEMPPATSTSVFGRGGGEPLPADQVFFPDVFAEPDGRVTFGLRMLPGYYIYKDKLELRSLSPGTRVVRQQLPGGEMIDDEWFGLQEIYYNDVLGQADLTRRQHQATTVEFEISYQGCKKDELCYLPVSRVIAVELPAAVESPAD